MQFCGNSTFWNSDLTLQSTWPAFTQCFHSTILVYVPVGFLWFSSIFYFPHLLAGEPPTPVPNTRLSIAKTTVSLLMFLISICIIIKEVLQPSLPLVVWTSPSHVETTDIANSAYYTGRAIDAFTFILTAILVQLERRRQVMASGVLFIFWLLHFLSDVIPFYTYIILKVYTVDSLRFSCLVLVMALSMLQFIMHCMADTRMLSSSRCSERDCPEVTASFPSRLTFSWLTKLVVTGYRRPLTSDDLWQLNPRDNTASVLGRFFWAWRKYKRKCTDVKNAKHQWSFTNSTSSTGSSDYTSGSSESTIVCSSTSADEKLPLIGPEQRSKKRRSSKTDNQIRRIKISLVKVLCHGFGWDIFLSYCCKAVSDVLQFTGPYLLQGLILYIENSNSKPSWQGYVLAGAMLVSTWIQSIFYHQHYHLAMTAGMRMKAALMAAVYKKSLTMGKGGQQDSTTGELVNLMSVDCQRIQDLMSYTWMLWSIPLQIFLAIYLLWSTMGYPVLSGLTLLVLLVPLNAYVAYRQQALQRENLSWKDLRIRIINEVLSGIKVLKLYAWEESFQWKILRVRQREIKTLTKLAWLNALNIFVWTCVPYMVCLASFATFVIVFPSQVLTADMAFVTLSLFNILQFPISFIPEFISYSTQAQVSISRLSKYLSGAEQDKSNYRKHNIDDIAVRIHKGSFTWNPTSSFRLTGIKLEIPQGALVAVVGPVGSGKSSLLNAILGEMDRLQGKVSVSGSIAYTSQQPWIQNATLKENVLFGSSFVRRKYDKTLYNCALKTDIENMPGGESTEIGEEGINLSGGQKQRLSLARAVYADAEIYLLDDPLSALDSQVGKHIFKRVLSEHGVLKRQTRILTTHAVHWLPLVDIIVVMHEGKISEVGSYLQLMKRDGPFAQFLLSHFKETYNSDEKIVDEDQEVKLMKQKMWEHVECLTSASEGDTSNDDVVKFHQKSLERMCQNGNNGSDPNTPTEENGQNLKNDEGFNFRDVGQELSPPPTPTQCIIQLTAEEATQAGSVKFEVFNAYCRNVGYFSTFAILLLFAMFQVSSVLANVWLSRWTGDPVFELPNITDANVIHENKKYLTVYGLLGAAQAFFVLIYACLASQRMVAASSSMHAAMLDNILKSPLKFFNTTPNGRIINRFSRDVETLDNQMPQIIFMFILCVFSVLATLTVISVNTPIFTVVVLPLLICYIAIQRFFVPTSRQLKRLESVTRSPIYSLFSETLSGSQVIRAFAAVNRFVQSFIELIDKNQVFYFAGITANRWLGVWIEVISSLLVFFSAIFSLNTPGMDGAVLGLSVSYALQITQGLKWLVRTMSDIETNSVSIERVDEYSHLETEPPRRNDVRPPKDWPDRGDIIFHGYNASYREGLNFVLKDLYFHINPGEKIGVVGRTGAGKSSLALALFRMLVRDSGDIIIDNINIENIGLYDLRSRITILPQDPVIMSGSLRSNVDPMAESEEKDIWAALNMSNLLYTVTSWPKGLNTELGETGLNLSSGQRQLVCLTRALLRKSKILILDEPTSSVDMETDQLVQQTIRKAFKHCTTITVAHRISTVLDCDRVIVLDDGGILEMDTPHNLLEDISSRFHRLARNDRVLHG